MMRFGFSNENILQSRQTKTQKTPNPGLITQKSRNIRWAKTHQSLPALYVQLCPPPACVTTSTVQRSSVEYCNVTFLEQAKSVLATSKECLFCNCVRIELFVTLFIVGCWEKHCGTWTVVRSLKCAMHSRVPAARDHTSNYTCSSLDKSDIHAPILSSMS